MSKMEAMVAMNALPMKMKPVQPVSPELHVMEPISPPPPEPRLTARQQRLICAAYAKHPNMTPQMLALWAKSSFLLRHEPSPSTIWKVLKCGKKRERVMCPRRRAFLLHKDMETLQRKKLDELLVSWVLARDNQNVRTTIRLVKHQAKMLCMVLKIPESARPDFSNAWLASFIQHYGLQQQAWVKGLKPSDYNNACEQETSDEEEDAEYEQESSDDEDNEGEEEGYEQVTPDEDDDERRKQNISYEGHYEQLEEEGDFESETPTEDDDDYEQETPTKDEEFYGQEIPDEDKWSSEQEQVVHSFIKPTPHISMPRARASRIRRRVDHHSESYHRSRRQISTTANTAGRVRSLTSTLNTLKSATRKRGADLRIEELRCEILTKRIKVVEEKMLARQRLEDAGVSKQEIEKLLPLTEVGPVQVEAQH